MLRGIGTSKGIGIGHALLLTGIKENVVDRMTTDIAAEKLKYAEAKEEFIKETETLIDKLTEQLGDSDKNALILKNQIYLINDVEMTDSVNRLIEDKSLSVEAAVEQTCNTFIQMFLSMDNEAMNQRAADIEDMKNRVIQILHGVKRVDLTHLPENTIIIAEEIHPSMTAGMDVNNVAGIISEKGGDTSHAAILAVIY